MSLNGGYDLTITVINPGEWTSLTEALVGYGPAPLEVPGPVGSQGITGVLEEGSGRHVDSAFTHSLPPRKQEVSNLLFFFTSLCDVWAAPCGGCLV